MSVELKGTYIFLYCLLAAMLLGSNFAHADIFKCVSEDGQVVFRKSIFNGETCTKLDLNRVNNTKSAAAPQPKKVASEKTNMAAPSSAQPTDFVLVCEEIEFTDFRLFKSASGVSGWTKEQHSLFDYVKSRNENPKRPYFALKYVGGKLSFNKSGNAFLSNETPSKSNYLGWVGEIEIREDSIIFELKDVEIPSRRMRTNLKIDRYTGLYKDLSFAPDSEESDYGTTGKCAKYSEKLF